MSVVEEPQINDGFHWTEGQRRRLISLYEAGWKHERIAHDLGRSIGSVGMEITRLRQAQRLDRASRVAPRNNDGMIFDLPPWVIIGHGRDLRSRIWDAGVTTAIKGRRRVYTIEARDFAGGLMLSPIEQDRGPMFREEFAA